MYPCGEEANDIRFEALRSDLTAKIDQLVYAVYKAQGLKVKKPKCHKFDAFKIFDRGGPKKRSNDFRDMDQSEIAKQMNAMAIRMCK